MLSAQYESNINVWSFDNSDCYHTGKLVGHNTQVTALQILNDTPLVISADEIVIISLTNYRGSLKLGILDH
jgi:hypothetical protein